jgi:hypothetical protein
MRRHYAEIRLDDPDSLTISPPRALAALWQTMRRRVVVAYGATRNLSDYIDTRHSSLSPDVRRVMTLFDPLAQVTSAEFLLKTRTGTKGPLPRLVQALLNEVFEGEVGVELSKGRLRFTVGGQPVEALDLPDGFRSSVAWLVDLCDTWCKKARPRKDLATKPEDVEAIVLVDEIDLHLHPSLQRTLIPRLRKAMPRVQWVVSTHSPLVISSFDAAELVALDRSEPGGIRVLDRQILGFTTDQVYNWLMGTPATSAALEEALARPGAPGAPSAERLAQVLDMSPEVDADEAARRAEQRQARLKRLKS